MRILQSYPEASTAVQVGALPTLSTGTWERLSAPSPIGAKERQREAGGDRKSENAKTEKSVCANLREAVDSSKMASKAVNVGERIVQDAQFVRDHDPGQRLKTSRLFHTSKSMKVLTRWAM